MLTPPGWNSIETAATYARVFTYAGWVSLFLLGIFEILAHVYGVRKDALVVAHAQAIKSTDEAEITRLKKKVEFAQSVASGASGAASKAEEMVMQEQAARLHIEEKLAPRHLSKEQQQRIIAKCKAVSGKPFVPLVNQDPEAIDFLNVIEELLDSCGWSAQSDDVFGFAVTTRKGNKVRTILGERGVICAFSPDKIPEFGPAVKNLASALASEGIDVETGTNTTLGNPNAIYIIVGKKP